LQRLLGNMDNDGKSQKRPVPTVAPSAAPANPAVGMADPAQLIEQARAEEGRTQKVGKERKSKRTAAAAPAPGFNLN
jgi:hypothetical protein